MDIYLDEENPTSESDEDKELNLHKNAELAADIMLDSEATKDANLSHEIRYLVAHGLTEKLKRAHHLHGLDVAELRHRLELSQGAELEKEDGFEL